MFFRLISYYTMLTAAVLTSLLLSLPCLAANLEIKKSDVINHKTLSSAPSNNNPTPNQPAFKARKEIQQTRQKIREKRHESRKNRQQRHHSIRDKGTIDQLDAESEVLG